MAEDVFRYLLGLVGSAAAADAIIKSMTAASRPPQTILNLRERFSDPEYTVVVQPPVGPKGPQPMVVNRYGDWIVDPYGTIQNPAACPQQAWIQPSSNPINFTYGTNCVGQKTQTAGIQEAINYVLNNGGGKVLIRPGTYKIQTSILVVGSNIEITGSGYSTRLVLEPPNPDNNIIMFYVGALYLNGQQVNSITFENIKIRNMFIDGNSRNLTGLYTESNGAPVQIGIDLVWTKNVEISGIYFYDTAREAIWVPASTSGLGVYSHEDIFIHDNVFDHTGYGITLEQSRHVVIANNIVKNVVPYPSYWLSLNYLSLHSIAVVGNVLDAGGTTSQGIIEPAQISDPQYVVIANNVIKGYGTGPSLFVGGGTYVVGNIISGSAMAYGGNASQPTVLEDNIFELSPAVALAVQGNYVTVKDNVFVNNNISNSGTYPDISFTANISQGVYIIRNIFLDTQSTPTSYGIGALSNVTVSGVTFIGNKGNLGSRWNGGYFPQNFSNCVYIDNDFDYLVVASTPAVPSSGSALTNPFNTSVRVYLYGGTVTQVQITKWYGTTYTVFSNSSGASLPGIPVYLDPGDSITITYSSAPTWVWVPA